MARMCRKYIERFNISATISESSRMCPFCSAMSALRSDTRCAHSRVREAARDYCETKAELRIKLQTCYSG